jgi:SAM-dependent methyltransferase
MNKSEKFEELSPGASHYKAYVGPPKRYDLVGAMQFNLLTSFGLRDYHKLLDIGCGSLRSGKLMIPYLRKGNYYGIEPNQWLIDDGIKYELGKDIISLKSPSFNNSSEFEFQIFDKKFDFLIAQSIFSHASASQISNCLKEAKAVMKQEGLFLATFVLGKINYTGTDWVYPDCVNYRHDYILELVKNQKLDAIQLKWLHATGQTWYVIFHPENRNTVKMVVENLFTKNKIKYRISHIFKKYRIFNNRVTRKFLRILKAIKNK